MGDASVPQGQGAMPPVAPPQPEMTPQPEMPPMSDGTSSGDMEPSGDMGMGQSPDRTKKEIQKNIGKACADFRGYQGQDKEDLKKWVEGMLDSVIDDSDISDEENGEPPVSEPEAPMPMESVIFTKGQLKKINETFCDQNIEDKEEKETSVKSKKDNNNSPFSSPKLNIK